MDATDKFFYKLFDIFCLLFGICCAIIFIGSVVSVIIFFWYACWPMGLIATIAIIWRVIDFIKYVTGRVETPDTNPST